MVKEQGTLTISECMSRIFDLYTYKGKGTELALSGSWLLLMLALVERDISMGFQRIELGRPSEVFTNGNVMKAAVAEFISTLIFVFAGEGSAMALSKISSDASSMPGGLVAVALSHALALFVAVAVAANTSGGHINPAVTFGAFIGGHISLLKAILYWNSQLMGSIMACLLLKFTSDNMTISALALAPGYGVGRAVVLEIVMTFGLVYTVFVAAIDPKKGSVGVIAPMCIGFMVGANILCGGVFDGASMNPARAFGPALVSWTWTHHWVYWVGPLLGGSLAAIVYHLFLFSPQPQLPTADGPSASSSVECV
eukprot:Gb_26570 [translate_table: standard]